MSKLKERKTGEIDRYDREIIKLLQNDSSVSLQHISEKISLSAPAVQRRIKRLEKENVIESYVALLNADHLGLPTTIIATVNMVTERLDLYESIKKSFIESKYVQQCYHVAGKSDFVVILTVSGMEEYEEVTRELFFENKNVKNFTTFVSMERVKYGLQLPL